MQKTFGCLGIVLLMGLGSAHSAAGQEVEAPSTQQVASEADTGEMEPIDPLGNTSRALLHTTLPIGVGIGVSLTVIGVPLGAIAAAYGLFSGPSMGNFYAADYLRGGLGFSLRLAGLALFVVGAFAVIGPSGEGTPSSELGAVAMVIGLGLYVGSIIWNIVTADDSAREHNEAHRTQISVQPHLNSTHRAAGLSLRWRF